MQKKLIAVALAGLASSAAFAADSVTIYGNLDVGYVNRGSSNGAVAHNDRTHALDSGVSSLNVLGFKGSESLGNGLTAIFALEAGFGLDDGMSTQQPNGNTGRLFSNQAYVGLTGNFGTAVAGRLMGVRYAMINEYDPFHGGTVGDSNSLYGHVKFANNAIAYISPSFNGFNVLAAYSTSLTDQGALATPSIEQPGNVGDGRLWAVKPAYKNGPISVAYDHEDLSYKGRSGSLRIDVAGGSYDFGVVKAMLSYDRLIGSGDLAVASTNLDSTAAVGALTVIGPINTHRTMIGASAPFGAHTLKANYIWLKDKETDNNAQKWAIGYQYDLSKRTALFADYSRVQNKNDAAYVITTATDATGMGTTGFDLGLRHSF